MRSVLESRKFAAAVLASLISMVCVFNGISIENIAAIITPLLLYIGAQGIADMGVGISGSDTKKPVKDK